MPMEVNSIGNRMSDYFADMGLAFYHGTDFNDKSYNNENHPLYPYIPHSMQFDPAIQEQLKSAISPESMSLIADYRSKTASWVVINEDFYTFWTILKPTVNKILSDLFEKMEMNTRVECPILHYRCSDVPFWRAEHYHIQRFQYYKDTLTEIKSKGIDTKRVIISYNGEHQSGKENKETCDKYIEMLREYLSLMNIESDVTSSTNMEDFAQLFYAPAVISTGGSFSFMSAFFGNGLFYTAPSEPVKKCEEKCDFIKPQYNIEHGDVSSYYDMDEMKGRFLQEKFSDSRESEKTNKIYTYLYK